MTGHEVDFSRRLTTGTAFEARQQVEEDSVSVPLRQKLAGVRAGRAAGTRQIEGAFRPVHEAMVRVPGRRVHLPSVGEQKEKLKRDGQTFSARTTL